MRMVADQEVVSRIELESQLQTKDDEIQFLKDSYEEKIKILMETDVGEYQVFVFSSLFIIFFYFFLVYLFAGRCSGFY